MISGFIFIRIHIKDLFVFRLIYLNAQNRITTLYKYVKGTKQNHYALQVC